MKLRSFQLGCHTLKIEYPKVVISPETKRQVYGQVSFSENTIKIAQTINGKKISPEVQNHTLHHELVHYIMFLMGKWKLNNDETFVDLLGGFFAQFNKTKR